MEPGSVVKLPMQVWAAQNWASVEWLVDPTASITGAVGTCVCGVGWACVVVCVGGVAAPAAQLALMLLICQGPALGCNTNRTVPLAPEES